MNKNKNKNKIKMGDIIIEIPSDISMALKIPNREVASVLRQELAIHLYSQHFLPFGKARNLARLTKWEFAELLGRRDIERHYDELSLQEDAEFANDRSQR